MMPNESHPWPSEFDNDIDTSDSTMSEKQLTEDKHIDIDARPTPEEVDEVALRISATIAAQASSYTFICKTVWRLGVVEAERLAGIAADKGNNPAKYFSFLAKRAMLERSLI